MSFADWLQLPAYFISISLLAVGGAMALAPDIHRFLVDERGWLTEAQFSASISLAQVAPGPNLLFIAVMGWNVGLNASAASGASAAWAAPVAMLLCLLGSLVPSATLTWAVTRWAHRNRDRLAVRAFRQGMTPVVVGLLLSTAWLLGRAQGHPLAEWRPWLLTVITGVIVWRTRIHLLWCLGAAAAVGAMGWL